MQRMLGSFSVQGQTLLNAGFMSGALGPTGLERGPSIPILSRGQFELPGLSDESRAALQGLQRGEIVGDVNQVLFHLGTTIEGLQRGITSGMTAFPTRENLEAEAKILVPIETPVRNMLPRVPGAGTASQWRQLTSLGGGWGNSLDQPGGGSATRMFFGEAGAPAEHTSVYAAKSMGYKLLGTYGSVTGFAMASGRNFQNQLATEKTNAVLNLMLNEEYALLSGDSSSTAAPWGDGSTAYAFDGLVTLIATGNGTPSGQVQTSVGALTTAHIDAQLRRLYNQGARDQYIIMNGQEILSLINLAQASGSIIRVSAAAGDPKGVLGYHITGYMHPITGEIVPIMASRFLAAGTIIFGAKRLPDGSNAAEVEVLPQVELPALAPNDPIQGYTAQELAPSLAAPQVYPFIVSVYEVLKVKSALHFAKSTGVTAVS